MENRIYVCEYKGENVMFGGQSHFVIVVAASDIELAREHVKEEIGFDCYPLWLMGATYQTIYTSNGSQIADKQVKILSNNNFHTKLG